MLGKKVIVRRFYKFQHGARAEVRAADADDNQNIGIVADTLRSRLDTGELLLIILCGQRHPAEKIIPRAGAVVQLLLRRLHFGSHCSQFLRLCEAACIAVVQTNTHCVIAPYFGYHILWCVSLFLLVLFYMIDFMIASLSVIFQNKFTALP